MWLTQMLCLTLSEMLQSYVHALSINKSHRANTLFSCFIKLVEYFNNLIITNCIQL